jgi:ADP-heptose:LPS heptosyltransferase
MSDARAMDGAPSAPRILLVRPDHLGDVLLTLPAVAALREALPAARLSYLVDESVAAIPSRCRAVDETLALSFPRPDAPFDPPEWREVVRATAPALSGRYDIAVLLRPEDAWSGRLVAAAEVPLRLGYAQPGTRPFLTRVLPPDSGRRHAARLAADLLAVVARLSGASLPPLRADPRPISPTDADEREASESLAPLAEATSPRPIMLHPGSGWRLKNWPAGRWGEMARTIARTHGVRPIIVGTPAEQALVDRAVDAAAGDAVTPVAPLTLGGLAAMHRRSRLVVSVDSGAAHLAAAMGAPSVVVFGPGDPRVARPWCHRGRCAVVRIDLPCSPCGRMHDAPCGADESPACVSAVTVERIAAAVNDTLRRTSSVAAPKSAEEGRRSGGGPV